MNYERHVPADSLFHDWADSDDRIAAIADDYRCNVEIVERLHSGEASNDDHRDFLAARAEFVGVEPLRQPNATVSWRDLTWDTWAMFGVAVVNVLVLAVLAVLHFA